MGKALTACDFKQLRTAWKYHKRPKLSRIRKALVKCKRALGNAEPDDESAGYRRGIIDALGWVLGENPPFDRRIKTRGD